ncbi:MAG: bifunctional precorrin-2 dehydrogenase/sirohydrochlorin ferrochelatase [Cytophagaceae bacterium]|nr:bifunctional precorrin-2 dehydrogenase/sirohydrochlorin ferrochelatase [Cytophagaceae bacterium]
MKSSTDIVAEGNLLFPVFFRLERLFVVVIGGGAVGTEKVTAILTNSPMAKIKVVAPEIRAEIENLQSFHPGLELVYKTYEASDLMGADLVVAATCIVELNKQVHADAKKGKQLINVADTPELCDFYLSSIVKKGDLKIAISTNGKSPTFAKRLREILTEALPDSIDAILQQLHTLRNSLKGDFEFKVQKMDEITKEIVNKKDIL